MIHQIVISKLKDVEGKDEFMQLTQQMLKWLKNQKGFLSYQLYGDGVNFSDRLSFADKASADRINAAFLQTATCRRMLELVDPDYHGLMGEEIVLENSP